MFEYVKDLGLKPARPYTKRKTTDLIVLHHVEGNMTAKAIHEMHIKKGNKGIDYNIYVDKDGSVVWGRGLEFEGGHVNNKGKTAGMNARSVGIVCNGNFMKEKMSDAQLSALKKVVADVVTYYKFESVGQIQSHKEVAGAGYTDCPGTYFPTDEVREFIRQGGKPVTEVPATDSPANDPLCWQVTVGTLNYRRLPAGTVIGQLKRGDIVYLDRYVEHEDWARVRIGGKDGQLAYVWRTYIGKR